MSFVTQDAFSQNRDLLRGVIKESADPSILLTAERHDYKPIVPVREDILVVN